MFGGMFGRYLGVFWKYFCRVLAGLTRTNKKKNNVLIILFNIIIFCNMFNQSLWLTCSSSFLAPAEFRKLREAGRIHFHLS